MSDIESLADILKEIATTLQIERPLAVVDVETTGTWPKHDRIVQIAFATVQPNLSIAEDDTLINPEMPIPAEATSIHGINDEAVVGAPTFRSKASSLSQALAGHDFIGYNFGFDRDMLQSEFNRSNVPFSFTGARVIDPLILWQRLEPRSLRDAATRFIGSQPGYSHRADADIDTTVRVLISQLRDHGGTEQLPKSVKGLSSVRIDRDTNSLDAGGKIKWRDGAARLNFGKHRGLKLQEIRDQHPGYLEWILTGDFPDDVKEIISSALAGNYPLEPMIVNRHRP